MGILNFANAQVFLIILTSSMIIQSVFIENGKVEDSMALILILGVMVVLTFRNQSIKFNDKGVFLRRAIFIKETISWDLIDKIEIIKKSNGRYGDRTYLSLKMGRSDFDIDISSFNREKLFKNLIQWSAVKNVEIQDCRNNNLVRDVIKSFL